MRLLKLLADCVVLPASSTVYASQSAQRAVAQGQPAGTGTAQPSMTSRAAPQSPERPVLRVVR